MTWPWAPAWFYAGAPEALYGVSWLTTRPAFVFPLDRPARYSQPLDLWQEDLLRGRQRQRRVTNWLNERCVADGRPPAQHVAWWTPT